MANIIKKLKEKKLFIPICIFFGILIILISAFLLIPEDKKDILKQYFTPNIPIVIGWNFDLNYKKIPFNAEYIDFIFSEKLDNNTINKENINVSPELEWELSLLNSNTIRFSLNEKLEIWTNFLFSFSDKIKSKKWKNIKEISFDLEIVSSAKVVKITPEWNLENLNQNFAVFFNIPVVPLTDLDSRDSLPCPISFEPKVEWTCSWTTTSVLEFIPKERLFWATDYKIKVENIDWLLYKLEETKNIEVKTPDLTYSLWKNFSAKEWIKLNFNFPVSIEELQNKLSLLNNENKKIDIILETNQDNN